MSATFSTPRVRSEQLADGRLLLRSTEPLTEHPISVVHSFRAHSEATPGRVLVAERGPGSGWRTSTWGEVRRQADRLAQGLLDRGLADRPVMVLGQQPVAPGGHARRDDRRRTDRAQQRRLLPAER